MTARRKPAPKHEPEVVGKKMGRPSLMDDPVLIEKASLAYQVGYTDVEVAAILGVAPNTLYNWSRKSPDFMQLLKEGKAVADARVERSLYQRAVGYSQKTEKVFQHQGEIIRAEIVEHVPPDVTAAIFWLKNRQRDEWRDAKQVDLNVTERRQKHIEIINALEADAQERRAIEAGE